MLKWLVNSSSNFASSFIVMTHNSSVNFKLRHFLLWTKGSHQCPNFDTFKWSSENLPNSPCHFPNHKSVFLQTLHHSSVSWTITPLYFFSSNNKYFGQKETIFETFECSGQTFSKSSCQFSNDKSIHLQIFYRSSASWKITPLYFFLAQTIYTLFRRSPLKWKFLRLLSSLVKICQIPHVNFQTTSRFLSKFCITLQSHEI